MENVHTNIQVRFAEFFEPSGGDANDQFPFEMEGYMTNEEEGTDDMIGVFPWDYSFASIFNLKFLGERLNLRSCLSGMNYGYQIL